MTSIRIGVIAEDESDVDILRSVIAKSTKRPFKIQRYLGHGCGKLRTKCHAWAEQLYYGLCKLLIVVHDLDEHAIVNLRQQLEASIKGSSIKKRIVVIPIREIEAWLLADSKAVAEGMNIKQVKSVSDPQAEADAKKKLGDLVYRASEKKKRYLNTIHNKVIAAHLDLAKLDKLSSFKPLREFLKSNL